MTKQTSVAIAHEWVDSFAGSEQTFVEIVRTFPEASAHTLWSQVGEALDFEIDTSWIPPTQHELARAAMLPFMPATWRHLYRRIQNKPQVVITSSHAFARYFARDHAGLHASYVHCPMRYAWLPQLDIRPGSDRVPEWERRRLRKQDQKSLAWTDALAANSTETRHRIQQFYGRDAQVIPPPANIDGLLKMAPRRLDHRDGRLVALGRFVRYKRLDLAIDVAERIGLPLVIMGHGPEERSLRIKAAAASVPVTIQIRPPTADIHAALRSASALISPGIEDFGLVPVEAQAAGTPVIGPSMGGLLDSVIPGRTAVLAADQSLDALTQATQEALTHTYITPDACQRQASQFTAGRFRERLMNWIKELN